MGGCSLEKVRTSECSRVSFRYLIGSLGCGVYYLELLGIEVPVFCVCFKLFQEAEESSGCLLRKSPSVEGLSEISTMGNFLVIATIRYCDFLFDYSFEKLLGFRELHSADCATEFDRCLGGYAEFSACALYSAVWVQPSYRVSPFWHFAHGRDRCRRILP